MKCYCGYLDNNDMLKISSSGGVATAIETYFIEQNAIIYGVAYTEDFKGAEYIRVTEKKDIDRLKGSKYIKANTKLKNGISCYKSAIKDLEEGRIVLWIGLPCEILALKKMIENNKNSREYKLFTVDLICHGPTYGKVAEQFVDQIEKKYNSKIVEFSVRYKNPNWVPPYLFAKFENGMVYCEKFYKTDYGIAFSLLSMPGCYNCKAKGENHCADLTIGDYWGITKGCEGYNDKGCSAIICHSSKGEEIIKNIKHFSIFEADYDKIMLGNPRYYSSIRKTKDAEIFYENFKKKGLKKACWSAMSMKGKTYRIIKTIEAWIKKN